MENKFIKQLEKMEACAEALYWIRERDIDSVEEFWKVSNRSDWMLWLVDNKYPNVNIDIRVLQDLALEFASMALPHNTYKKQICIDCIYATYQYLDGWIDIDELKKYRNAVSVLSVVAGDWDATYSAAVYSAAASAIYAIYTTDATVYAINAAALTNTYYANAYTKQKIYKLQADLIRQYVPHIGN